MVLGGEFGSKMRKFCVSILKRISFWFVNVMIFIFFMLSCKIFSILSVIKEVVGF